MRLLHWSAFGPSQEFVQRVEGNFSGWRGSGPQIWSTSKQNKRSLLVKKDLALPKNTTKTVWPQQYPIRKCCQPDQPMDLNWSESIFWDPLLFLFLTSGWCNKHQGRKNFWNNLYTTHGQRLPRMLRWQSSAAPLLFGGDGSHSGRDPAARFHGVTGLAILADVCRNRLDLTCTWLLDRKSIQVQGGTLGRGNIGGLATRQSSKQRECSSHRHQPGFNWRYFCGYTLCDVLKGVVGWRIWICQRKGIKNQEQPSRSPGTGPFFIFTLSPQWCKQEYNDNGRRLNYQGACCWIIIQNCQNQVE